MTASAYYSEKRSWTQEELNFFSDLIATGSVVTAKEIEEKPQAAESETSQFRRIQITFRISETLKGKVSTDSSVVVDHYCLADGARPIADSDTNIYRLYLKKRDDERFEPTSGQMEPGISIRLHERRDPDHATVPAQAL